MGHKLSIITYIKNHIKSLLLSSFITNKLNIIISTYLSIHLVSYLFPDFSNCTMHTIFMLINFSLRKAVNSFVVVHDNQKRIHGLVDQDGPVCGNGSTILLVFLQKIVQLEKDISKFCNRLKNPQVKFSLFLWFRLSQCLSQNRKHMIMIIPIGILGYRKQTTLRWKKILSVTFSSGGRLIRNLLSNMMMGATILYSLGLPPTFHLLCIKQLNERYQADNYSISSGQSFSQGVQRQRILLQRQIQKDLTITISLGHVRGQLLRVSSLSTQREYNSNVFLQPLRPSIQRQKSNDQSFKIKNVKAPVQIQFEKIHHENGSSPTQLTRKAKYRKPQFPQHMTPRLQIQLREKSLSLITLQLRISAMKRVEKSEPVLAESPRPKLKPLRHIIEPPIPRDSFKDLRAWDVLSEESLDQQPEND